MKVLLWATSLQADILGLAYRLDRSPRAELLVVSEHARRFSESPIGRRRPLTAPLVDRGASDVERVVAAFRPDVVVCDNHFPHFAAAPRVCAMWHGLGWKARPAKELSRFYANVERLTGEDPRRDNPRFLAQCYHERDRRWRVDEWGLARERCAVIGSCFADLLGSEPPYAKAELEGEYGLDFSRKTVLVNVTWHYGRIFPGSWQPRWFGHSPFDADIRFLQELFARVHELGANVLFCLHDRKRYEPPYLDALHALSRRFEGRVALRHKDEHPDNWADLLVADAMLSNLSSFTTFFYQLGRPSVHLCPPAGTRKLHAARYSSSGLHVRRSDGSDFWMNDPHDNGGLSAENADAALEAVTRALAEPDCCRERSRDWLAAHVAAPPESAAARFEAELERLASDRAGTEA